MKLLRWWKWLSKKHWLFIGGLVGSIIIGCVLWKFDPVVINPALINHFTWAILTVVLIVSSAMAFLARLSRQMFQKAGITTPFLYPLILLIVAVFLSIIANITNKVFYVSASFLMIGTVLFFSELFILTIEETLGATIWERITYEAREKREPYLVDPSPITKIFQDKIAINKGEAILAICDSIEDGRALARKLISTARYGIYITDRPWTIIREEFKDYETNFYCIDCFTNFYGFEEFKKAEEAKEFARFYPYTLRPVTIRKLHNALRDTRKRIVAKILWKEENAWDISCEKDVLSRLNRKQKKEVQKELCTKEAEKERNANVRIIYDSVSSLASVFDIDELLRFLIHDTTVDKTIGRNTLLLVKEGVLEENIIKRMESFCEVRLNPKVKNGKINIHIGKIREEQPPGDFLIDC